MAIGHQIEKYNAEKAAKAAEVAAAAEAAIGEGQDVAAAETPSAPPKVTQTDLLAKMVELLSEIRTNPSTSLESKERVALEAERLLLEQERLKREMPENKQAPGISVFSYPEGELAHPKEPLKCKMFWVGYELTTDTLTPTEVQLLNKLQPGEFKVTKSDGTLIPFKVTATHNDRFQLDTLATWFPCRNEQRHNHGSMVSYLQQALGEHIPTAAELLVELERLKKELASARTGGLSAV